MLQLPQDLIDAIVAYCFDEIPIEACGLLAGNPATGEVSRWYPARNTDRSALTYTIDPIDHLKADRAAEDRGDEIIGVFHSHTHTQAYPSPTDVAKAPDPNWHYVLVSLRDAAPVVRSFRIVDGNIDEEELVARPGA